MDKYECDIRFENNLPKFYLELMPIKKGRNWSWIVKSENIIIVVAVEYGYFLMRVKATNALLRTLKKGCCEYCENISVDSSLAGCCISRFITNKLHVSF